MPIQFNATFYLRENPDVAAAIATGDIESAEAHFLAFGQFENRAPTAFFDPDLYLSENPDVADAIAAGLIESAYQHFTQFGLDEGRDPSIFFDTDFYLAANPDVAAAVAAGTLTAFEHFLEFGLEEVRDSAIFLDLQGYLDANPDVAAAVAAGTITAYDHFTQFGFTEGRDLGNGISLTFFASDPIAQAAIAAGDFSGLYARIAAIGPFVPGFEPPAGYEIPADQPIPQDFVPNEGTFLVVPEGVGAPGSLPPAFEQPEETGGGGGNPPDTIIPTLEITVSESVVNPAGESIVTFTFSEAPKDFTVEDISVSQGSGTISNLMVDGKDPLVYRAVFNPTAGYDGDTLIVVADGAYASAAGSKGAGDEVKISIDAEIPTVTVSFADDLLNKADTDTVVSFTFSETPVGFDALDLTLRGGKISDLKQDSDNDRIYTATFTAEAGYDDSGSVQVGTGYKDKAGNTGEEGAEKVSIDTLSPTVKVSFADPALDNSNNDTVVSFSFSETPVGFDSFDITTKGGTISGLERDSVNEQLYTATFTADTKFNGIGSVTVGDDYTDFAGNTGAGASNGIEIDTSPSAPTLVLDADSDSGTSDTDGVTSDATPTFTGTAAAGSTVTIFEKGVDIGTTTAEEDGTFTFTLAPEDALPDESYNFTAKATVDGNTSGPSGAILMMVDTHAPTATVSQIEVGLGALDADDLTYGVSIEGIVDGTVRTGDVVLVQIGEEEPVEAEFDRDTDFFQVKVSGEDLMDDNGDPVPVRAWIADAAGNEGAVNSDASYSLENVVRLEQAQGGVSFFSTLGAAIDAANTAGLSYATITVTEGTYAEGDLTITVPELAIRGPNASREEERDDPRDSDEAIIQGGIIIAATATATRIDGLSFEGTLANPTAEGATIFNLAGEVTILRNVIVGDPTTGKAGIVNAGGADDVDIYGNFISGVVDYGVYINLLEDGGSIENNTFAGDMRIPVVVEVNGQGDEGASYKGNIFTDTDTDRGDIVVVIRNPATVDLSFAGENEFNDYGPDIEILVAGGSTVTGSYDDDLIKVSYNTGVGATLNGGSGQDTLIGGDGDDFLNGGGADDILIGGGGADELTGGNGFDEFRFGALSSGDTITDFFDGYDVISLDKGDDGLLFNSSPDTGEVGFSDLAVEDFNNVGTFADITADMSGEVVVLDAPVADEDALQTFTSLETAEEIFLVVYNEAMGAVQLYYDEDTHIQGMTLVADIDGLNLVGVEALTAADFAVYGIGSPPP